MLLSQMDPAARHGLLEELFGKGGMGLSAGRIPIGSSDYSVSAYSYDDSEAPDPTLAKFSIGHDSGYVLPMIREAVEVNPALYLFGAPWSPPGWMKTANTLLGGAMTKKYMDAYADYFVKFLLEYQKSGVHLSAVTSQNETDTHQDGRMPAAIWGQEYEAEFVRDHLAPALRKSGLDTKIWLLDHNYDLLGRVMDQLSDPELCKAVDGVAWHGYVGKPESMTKVHEAYPEKGTYWTEGGSFFDDPKYRTEWAKWGTTFAGIVNNWARLITVWNFVLDEQGRPNIGPFDCGGLVQMDSKTHQIERSGLFYGLAHYSKAVQRGARVVETHGSVKGIDLAAFVNPMGERVVVLTNPAATTRVTLIDEQLQMEVELPGDSVTTLEWHKA
jgi:glucosylceramidase